MMKLLKWLSGVFTDSKGNLSSMRVILLLMGYTVWKMMYEVIHYLHVASFTTAKVDWLGISAYLGALTTLIGVVVYGKVTQTKIETKNPPSDEQQG